jgi:hypothetical protein
MHNTNCWHIPPEHILNLDSMMEDLFWGLLQNKIASVPIHQLMRWRKNIIVSMNLILYAGSQYTCSQSCTIQSVGILL